MLPHHTTAVILSTGDELMTGQLQDANACWLSEQLVEAGVMPVAHAAVGDALDDLVGAIRWAMARAPLVIMSGGLGPTDGDLTREAVCRATGDELVLDERLRAVLERMFASRGRAFTARQERQAHRPSRAVALPNAFGTAPGLHVRCEGGGAHGWSDVFCLLGPPGELRPMFGASVRPVLRPPAGSAVLTRLLHVVGLPEADCVDRLGDLTRRDRVPLVGITASGGVLTIRIRDVGAADGAAARVDAAEARVREALCDHVLPRVDGAVSGGASTLTGPGHLALHVIDALRHGRDGARTLAVVESCTGGMLGELITSISGASSVFLGGYVTYANAMKEAIGVSGQTLARHGAVSPETAREMALAGLAKSGAGLCLAITGIAGPDGGTPAKPVGTVYIGMAWGPAQVHTRHFRFTGDREDIRRRACVTALVMAKFFLSRGRAGEPRLLWEV